MTFLTVLTFLNLLYLLTTAVLLCYFKDDCKTNIHQQVNSELEKVNNWLQSNKNKMNTEKSNFKIFNYRGQTSIPPLDFGSSQFMEIEIITFLGTIFDKKKL